MDGCFLAITGDRKSMVQTWASAFWCRDHDDRKDMERWSERKVP